MEGIGLAILGIAVGLLGVLCTYVWKGNHRMEKAILEGQNILAEGQKGMMQALERIEEGQKEGFKALCEMLKNQTEMLFNQTKILERIEGKIPAPSA